MQPRNRRSPKPRLTIFLAAALAAATTCPASFALAQDISAQDAYRCNALDLNERILKLCAEHYPSARVRLQGVFHAWERDRGEWARASADLCATQISEMPEDEATATRAAMTRWLLEFTQVLETGIADSPLSICERWADTLSTSPRDVDTPPGADDQ